MKNKLLKILICGILFIGITGCVDNEGKQNEKQLKKEKFIIGHTLDDGRGIHFTFDVPYNDDSLSLALANNEISIDDFINRLDYIDTLNDGGSKLYKYNKNKELAKVFGNDDFYTIVCNSVDNIKDIYVAKYIENLNDKCTIKIDDLDGVLMTIKEETLTPSGATIIITDTSDRENIYGEPYRIDKFEDLTWKELNVIVVGNYGWTSIGYTVGKDNKLELDINWKWLYGELKPGKYRLVKDTSEPGEGTTHYITTEFTIN